MQRFPVIALVCAAAALSACNRHEGGNSETAPTSSTAPAAAPAPEPAPATTAPTTSGTTSGTSGSADSTGTSGTSSSGTMSSGTTVAANDTGTQVYNQTCVACHGAGVAGAPKIGDKADWGPRIAQGKATLYDHAIKGFTGKKGTMPPKGGSTRPDADIQAAVDYMVSQAK